MGADGVSRIFLVWAAAAAPLAAGLPDSCVPARGNGTDAALLKGTPFTCVVEAREGKLRVTSVQGSAVEVPLATREQLSRHSSAPVLAVSDGVWPGIRVSDPATATPSSEPWIDANTWVVRSIRAWSGPRPVWLTHTPPTDAAEGDYQRALAEVAAAGGYWLVPVEAFRRWPRLAAWTAFFEEHAEWRRLRPSGALGIVQDSTGKDPVTSGEYLNLIARRGVPYRVIERPQLNDAALAGLRVVLAADLDPPSAQEQSLLSAFEANGGTVIKGPGAPDPENLSKEMIELVGYEEAGARVYNAPSVMSYLAESQRERRAVLHLINYATTPAQGIAVHLKGGFRAARLLIPGLPPVDLKVERAKGRTEVSVPRFSVYAAIVWEGESQ